MDGPASAFPCMALAGGRRELRLRCLLPFEAQSGIAAHIAGLEVARLPVEGPVAAGQELLLPLRRLPRADLPAAIRFSTAAGAREIAPPFPLPSAAAAMQLFGPGRWRAEELRVELGVLRGLLLNAENGLAEPIAFARLNGAETRPVALGRPATLNDAGACWPFELPLLAEDLLDSGLTLALHVAGQEEAPLASLAWSRAWAGEEDRRLVTLEARLAELERGAQARLQQFAEEQRRREAEQAERIDAFIEYAGALLLDRAAATASREAGGDPALAGLRTLIAAAAQHGPVASAVAAPVPANPASRVVTPDSGHFSFGWHQLERDQGGTFRWMTQTGVVTNPEPQRLVTGAVVETLHLYGAARPALRARLDGAETAVSVEGEGPGRFRLHLKPAGSLPCRALRLESLAAGSPARDGASGDSRVLSLAVTRVVFDYAE